MPAHATVERFLESWEAAPVGAPLSGAGETAGMDGRWVPVRVPGHWQLEDAFGDHHGRVVYRCRFEGRRPGPHEMLLLRFGGVYYAARVWLNGGYLGAHEGYFAAFEFDCTDSVLDGTNELLVEVYSPIERDENDRETVGGVWACWDGMDPRINPGGVVGEVVLVRTGEVHLSSLEVRVDPSGRGRVFAGIHARRRVETELAGRVRPLGFEAPGAEFGEKVRVEAGPSRVELGFALSRPRLWWTWDRGGQPLYELSLSGAGGEGRARFGVRSVELRDWNVYLNGEQVFLRGVNSLPADAYPARASEERWRADAALVRDGGMNAVRVHAHVADQSFYAACDELGLLVFQDFPLQWTHRRTVLSPAVAQAREMARALRSHPSVGLYLAHDEPFYVAPPEKWTYPGLLRTAAEVLAPRWASWQRRVLDPAIVETLEREDPAVPVIDAAGHPGTTNHLYFGWYYGGYRDLERLVGLLPGFSRLPTEYGAQALPDPDSLEEIWPEGQEPDWDRLSSVYRLQAGRMQRYVPWKGDRGRYVRESQAYQTEVLKHATEYFRRRKYRPTGGTFAFMLNDPAPAISWSVLDWRRRPKKAFEALRAAMAPVLICAKYPRERYPAGGELSLPLFVLNDFSRPLGRLDWAWALSLDGSEVARGSGSAEIGADSVTKVGRAAAVLQGRGRAALRLSLEGEGVRSDNAYGFLVGDASRP